MAKQKIEAWLPLYELAEQVKELAPWQWMEETDVFGVQDPKTGEIGFVSIMGMAGEHLAIGVYLGVEAYLSFLELEEFGMDLPPWETGQALLTIPQIQVSFEDRDMIEKDDAHIMRQLKRRYKGRNAYPVFRTLHPGSPPILLDMEQIPFLTHILEQTLHVVPRFQEDEELLYPEDIDDEEAFFLRVAEEKDGELIWKDDIRPLTEPPPKAISFEVSTDSLEKLKQVPHVGNSVEIDLFMLMAPVEDKKEIRPFFPFILVVVDVDSGQVLAQDIFSPLPTIDEMYASIPQRVIDMFLKNNFLPHEIHTQHSMITAVLLNLFESVNVPVVEQPFLPMTADVKAAMFSHFSQGFE